MESGINLLPEITEKEIKAGVYRRKVNVAAMATLAVVGVIILALISYQVYLSIRATNVENRSKEAEARIRQNSQVEIINLALKQKLDKIKTILEAEIPTSTLIDKVTEASATSQPIALQGMSAQSDGTVTVEGTAVNSSIFKEWAENLTKNSAQPFFSKVQVVSLTGDGSGYKFQISLSFLKKGVYTPNESQ